MSKTWSLSPRNSLKVYENHHPRLRVQSIINSDSRKTGWYCGEPITQIELTQRGRGWVINASFGAKSHLARVLRPVPSNLNSVLPRDRDPDRHRTPSPPAAGDNSPTQPRLPAHPPLGPRNPWPWSPVPGQCWQARPPGRCDHGLRWVAARSSSAPGEIIHCGADDRKRRAAVSSAWRRQTGVSSAPLSSWDPVPLRQSSGPHPSSFAQDCPTTQRS